MDIELGDDQFQFVLYVWCGIDYYCVGWCVVGYGWMLFCVFCIVKCFDYLFQDWQQVFVVCMVEIDDVEVLV